MKQRELKFRVWDLKYKVMRPSECVTVYGDGTFEVERLDEEGNQIEYCGNSSMELVLLEYTGLKDRHGKEIYEGDKLKGRHWEYDEDIAGEVVWNEDSWALRSLKGRKELIEFWNDGSHNWYNLGSFMPDEQLEVIGNIYQ